jgi:preprotein translocase subunit SecD
MMIWANRFNIYLLLVLAALLAAGCQSPEKKRSKALSSLRIHGEATRDASDRSTGITIFRSNPIMVQVERTPIATEANVKQAKLVQVLGGFAIQIQLDRRGSWLLEQFTTMNRGRRLAVFSQFVVPPAEKPNEERWLAAPRFAQPINNGLLLFTPDATEEEAEQIVKGLNNAAKKYQDKEPNW